MRRLARNLLEGLGLGAFIATGLSAYALLLQSQVGPAPFDRLHTTIGATVLGYYEGGAAGGLLMGLAWPLRRWLLGCLLLGILGVWPLYFFSAGTHGSLGSSARLTTSLLGALFVGGAAGTWVWSEEHRQGPPWFDLLRFPTRRAAIVVWAVALLIATLGILMVPRWSSSWPFQLTILAAGLLFVVPVLIAVLVTMRYYRRLERR